MKSVTRKEKIEYLIITVLLMILVAEGFAIRDIRVENREQQEVTVSERVYLKHNTKSYDVPFYMWIDGTGDADRIHKLESIVSVIKETDPEMYKTFVNDIEWEDDSREDDDLEYADAWDKNDNGIPDYAEDDR